MTQTLSTEKITRKFLTQNNFLYTEENYSYSLSEEFAYMIELIERKDGLYDLNACVYTSENSLATSHVHLTGISYISQLSDALMFLKLHDINEKLTEEVFVDWKSFGIGELWKNWIDRPHEMSGYYEVDTENHPMYKKGGVYPHLSVSSIIHPREYHELTWHDLMYKWNVMRECIMTDTHDCTKCPDRKDCRAFFKDDKSHNQCSWWQDNVDSSLKFIPDYGGQ